MGDPASQAGEAVDDLTDVALPGTPLHDDDPTVRHGTSPHVEACDSPRCPCYTAGLREYENVREACGVLDRALDDELSATDIKKALELLRGPAR